MKKTRIAIMASTTVLFFAVVFTACENNDSPEARANEYTIDGVTYSIDTAFEYASMHGGGTSWRMNGEAFPGATSDMGTPINQLKFVPYLGAGSLEGSYTVDNNMEPAPNTFTYDFTANYQGFSNDSTTVDNPTGTLEINKIEEGVYEFKLEGGKLILGAWKLVPVDTTMEYQFITSGYEPSYSVYYKGPVTPAGE